MINPFTVWNRFFFQLQSARPLGVIRICYGLLALANLALCSVDIDHWFSGEGLLQGEEARVMAGNLIYSPLHYLQSPFAIRVAFGFTGLAALGLTVGWRTKLMSILFYGGMVSIHNRNMVSSSGADVLLLVFGFNLLLSPAGAAYSVDTWLSDRKRGTRAEPLILAWSLRLIQIQICLVYTMAALLKCNGGLWMNGSALHYVLNNAEVRRLNLTFLSEYPILINAMTYSALAFELSLAFFLWFRAVRPIVIGMGIMLHLGILATVNIPIFGELMWIGYIAFLTPPEFAAFIRAIDIRCWFRSKQAVSVRAEAEVLPATEMGVATDLPPLVPVAEAPARPLTIRIDGPAPPPTPHRAEPKTTGRPPTAQEFVEAAMNPWDSFQILM